MDANSIGSNNVLIDIRFDSSEKSEQRVLAMMKRAIQTGVEYYFTVDPDQTQHFVIDASPEDIWFVLGDQQWDPFVDETYVLHMRKSKMARIDTSCLLKQTKPYRKSKLSSLCV
jgi:hypothetical protein